MWCTSAQPASARRPETRWRFHLSRCPGFGVHLWLRWIHRYFCLGMMPLLSWVLPVNTQPTLYDVCALSFWTRPGVFSKGRRFFRRQACVHGDRSRFSAYNAKIPQFSHDCRRRGSLIGGHVDKCHEHRRSWQMSSVSSATGAGCQRALASPQERRQSNNEVPGQDETHDRQGWRVDSCRMTGSHTRCTG